MEHFRDFSNPKEKVVKKIKTSYKKVLIASLDLIRGVRKRRVYNKMNLNGQK